MWGERSILVVRFPLRIIFTAILKTLKQGRHVTSLREDGNDGGRVVEKGRSAEPFRAAADRGGSFG